MTIYSEQEQVITVIAVTWLSFFTKRENFLKKKINEGTKEKRKKEKQRKKERKKERNRERKTQYNS